MLRFHIKTEYDDTVIRGLKPGYNNTDNDFNIYLANGEIIKDASYFTGEYIQTNDFFNHYENIKLRIPKGDFASKIDNDRDYYEFIPKVNSDSNRFLLIVDKNIKDYEKITVQIDDAKLKMQMNKDEISKKLKK